MNPGQEAIVSQKEIINAPAPVMAGATPVRETVVTFECDDGFPLTGTLFTAESGQNSKPSVLISSATGAPRGFYASFARALVENGSRAVLTYDYRGTPQSPRPKGWTQRINMRDWAIQDMAAAMHRLDAEAPGHEMAGVGQSFGGQALGICGDPQRFSRYCLVASLSGYWRGTDTPWQNLISMNLVGLPVTALFGRTMPFMGLGESIPSSVFQDWTRWCNHHEYFFDDPQVGAREGYATVTIPLLSVGMTDDLWGTPRAVRGLLKHYSNADISEVWLSPDMTTEPKIGHLGFFRSRFRDTLWPDIIDWVLNHEPVGTAAR